MPCPAALPHRSHRDPPRPAPGHGMPCPYSGSPTAYAIGEKPTRSADSTLEKQSSGVVLSYADVPGMW
jgi:hypothetical protein